MKTFKLKSTIHLFSLSPSFHTHKFNPCTRELNNTKIIHYRKIQIYYSVSDNNKSLLTRTRTTQFTQKLTKLRTTSFSVLQRCSKSFFPSKCLNNCFQKLNIIITLRNFFLLCTQFFHMQLKHLYRIKKNQKLSINFSNQRSQ